MRTRTSISPILLVALTTVGLSWAGCSSQSSSSTPPGSTTTTATTTTTSAGGAGQGGAGGGHATGTGGQGGAIAGSPIEAHFALPPTGAPNLLDVPFPSDVYLGKDGLVGDVPGLDAYFKKSGAYLLAGWASSDGFGTTAGAMFRIDDRSAGGAGTPPPAALDEASFPADEDASVGSSATVMIVDLSAATPGAALVRARVEYHDDSSLGAKTRPLLVVFPARGVVLAEKHRYAFVLTTGVKAKDGKALGPSADFAAVRDGKNRTTDAEKLYGDAVDKVATLVPALADKSKIAALAVFTTHGVAQELADLRAAQSKATPPALSWDAGKLAPMGPGLFANAPLPEGFTATLDAWLGAPAKLGDGTDDPAGDSATGRAHDALAAIGTAVFDAPNYLVEDAAKSFGDPQHHLFKRDANGKVIVNPDAPTSKVWMTIALPKGAVPQAGFPTVVFQHGLGQDRSLVLSIADTLAKKGWATVAIESVSFGARAPEAGNTVDAKAGFAWSGGAGAYDGPDGFVDTANGSSDFFGGLQSLGACRDQMRQSVLDIGAAFDMIRDPGFDLGPLAKAVPAAKLDGTRIAYIGNSLGAIMGSIVAAVEPHVTTYVLNVLGGGLMTELGSSSPYIASSLGLAGSLNYGFPKNRYTPGHPLVQALQHILDAGDPLLYASHVTLDPLTAGGAKNPPKNVVQIEVLWDEIVANSANEAFARAAGFPLAGPNVGSMTNIPLGQAAPNNGVISNVPSAGVTAVVVQAGPAVHGGDLFDAKGGHTYAIPFPRFDQADPFPKIPTPFEVNQPYAGLQGMSVDFIASAFAGGGAPVVKGFPTPVNDYDGDGVEDSKDADPNDPNKH
jgi:hypothetical protein